MTSVPKTCFFTLSKLCFLFSFVVLARSTNNTRELEASTVNYDYIDQDYLFLDNVTIVPLEGESSQVETKNFTYEKCFCGIQEIRKGNECISIGPDVVISQLQDMFPHSDVLFDFFLSPVNTGNPRCSETEILVELKNNLFILGNGDLYSEETDTLIPRNEFCFELIKEEGIIKSFALACIERPKLPVCGGKSSDKIIGTLDVYFGSHHTGIENFELLDRNEPQCNETFSSQHELLFQEEKEKIAFHLMSGNIGLLWQPPISVKGTPKLYSVDEYCIIKSPDSTVSFSISLCFDNPVLEHQHLCKNSTCVRKCCPQHEVYNSAQRKCLSHRNSTISSFPIFYDHEAKSFVSTPEDLLTEYSFPLCPPQQMYLVDPKVNPGDDFFLLQNGSLYMTLSKLTIPPSHYCLDSFHDEGGAHSIKAISCFLHEEEKEKDVCKEVIGILYPILISISCLFLVITLVVYSVIPELHAKLHGKSLVSHVSALLVAFICQIVVFLGSKSLSMNGCKIIALGTQLSFLWAFFWLNVMCFDIWWTLKSKRVIPETGESSRRRFVLYTMYAWGCPVLICFVTAVMEFLPNSLDKSGLILPGFGVRDCWFQDAKSTWLYFYGFTLTLHVLNIFFFFHVAAILINSQRSTEGILRTTKKQHKERVYLYLKLFAVMGITWVCEVASWQEGTCKYWIFTDIVNSLQGVMIFFIFMCNKKVFQKLHSNGVPLFRRVKAFVRSPSSVEPGDTRTNSSTSHSQRTTQATEESSMRRLSSSSSPLESQLTKK